MEEVIMGRSRLRSAAGRGGRTLSVPRAAGRAGAVKALSGCDGVVFIAQSRRGLSLTNLSNDPPLLRPSA